MVQPDHNLYKPTPVGLPLESDCLQSKDKHLLVPMTEQPLSLTVTQALELDLRRKGMTQEQLGTELGVSQQAISGWITDNRIPDRRMPALIKILGKDSETAKVEQIRQNFLLATARDQAIYFSEDRKPATVTTGSGALGPPVEPRRHTLREYTVFASALPPELRRNMEQARVQFGSSSRRLDYLSDKVALELVAPSMLANQWAPARLAPAMMQLLVAKQATLATHPDRQYILGVILPADAQITGMRQLQALATDAELLGLVLATTNDVNSLAKYIVALEEGRVPFEEQNEVPDEPDLNPAYGDLLGGVKKADENGGQGQP